MQFRLYDSQNSQAKLVKDMKGHSAKVDCPRQSKDGLELTLRFSSKGDGILDTNLIATFSPEDTAMIKAKYPDISAFKEAFIYLGQNEGYLVI